MSDEDARQRIKQLERQNRILQKKLARSEANRSRIEEARDKDEKYLRTMLDEFRQAQDALLVVNQELEGRVAERTQELVVANEQLVIARDDALTANQAKSSFLARMSHELRTPLNAIIGYTEMVREELLDLDQPMLAGDLSKVATAGRHLLHLINGVLDLSKVEAGKMELHVETFELADLLQSLHDTVRPLAMRNRNDLIIENRCAPGTQLITDRHKVYQSLLNALSNSCKFTEEGEVAVVVYCRDDDQHVLVFDVSDTGEGIPEESFDSLFEPFRQVERSNIHRHDGTGLGLAIAQRFMTLMGGEIFITSQVGVGTTMSFHIPRDLSDFNLSQGTPN